MKVWCVKRRAQTALEERKRDLDQIQMKPIERSTAQIHLELGLYDERGDITLHAFLWIGSVCTEIDLMNDERGFEEPKTVPKLREIRRRMNEYVDETSMFRRAR